MMLYRFIAKNVSRRNSFKYFSSYWPDIDLNYYCNKENSLEINHNINRRKGIGDINKVLEMYKVVKSIPVTDKSYEEFRQKLYSQLILLPNKTHPKVLNYNEDPIVVEEINSKRDFGGHKALEFSEIAQVLNLIRTEKLGYTCGNKSYYYLGELAELEEALIKYTVSELLNRNFNLISVPDILSSNILRGCGMAINSDRTQIYSLDPVQHGSDMYLSGTAEMSLAGLLLNSRHKRQSLPIKLAAVSRCYRAETSNIIEERGTYRVHQFTKVEMFIATTADQSEPMLEELIDIQKQLFTPLDLHMKVLDMPPHELGAPAYRKYDIEVWMPGKNGYGEISSCSNCTDYQSRRLNIMYDDQSGEHYVHTLNGTACAIPRMLIALLETHQDPKGKIKIPKVLQPFMNGKEYISKNVVVPRLKISKLKK